MRNLRRVFELLGENVLEPAVRQRVRALERKTDGAASMLHAELHTSRDDSYRSLALRSLL